MKIIRFIIYITILLLLSFCNESTVENETENNLPQIISITANPDTITSGESTQLVLNVIDPDGDELTFIWESSFGSISGNGDTVVWSSPSLAGEYFISCKVLDSNNGETTDSVKIIVQEIIPSLNLISPIGGELFTNNDSVEVKWESENVSSVNLYISYNDGMDWNHLANNIRGSDGSFSLILAGGISYSCKIKISDADNPYISDVSNSTFTLINIDEAKEFYKLNLGNIWVYTYTVSGPGGQTTTLERHEVLDEIIINNKKYTQVNVNNSIKYFRLSNYGDLVELKSSGELTILNMSWSPGKYQISPPIAYFRKDTSKIILGSPYEVKYQKFEYGAGGTGSWFIYEYAKGIGKIFFNGGSFESSISATLNGAVIDQIVIGDTSFFNSK